VKQVWERRSHAFPPHYTTEHISDLQNARSFEPVTVFGNGNYESETLLLRQVTL